jgi:mono/diheme cytochrome c family protein
VLTADQLEALVAYSIDAASGSTVQVGQQLFSEYCAVCHGALGEGGPNPARPDDVIAPISTAEYLKTRDDFTLKAIIEQGQPNFGMSPFGVSAGGPLDGEQIEAIVAFLRSWEMDPPVEFPPEVRISTVSLSGDQIYADLCAQCHGEFGEGLIGPAFDDSDFQASFTDQELFDSINSGHEATAMIAWGEVLNSEQIEDLVSFIRQLRLAASGGPVSFADDVLPILQAECAMCHGAQGGWDASSYEAVMTTGNNAPVVVPGYVEFSLLAQKIQDTQTSGMVMPTAGKMSDANIQVILNWIIEGALDN